MYTQFSLENVFRIDSFELITQIILNNLQTGIHPSRNSGYSDEFHDYRTYSGEDSKYIDWKLYARTDKLFIRKYHERVATSVHVVLDVSASMDYGTHYSKSIFSRYLTAIVSFLALRQRDSVSVHAISDGIQLLCRNAHTRKELMPMCKHFETAKDTGKMNLFKMHNHLTAIKNSIVFYISDIWYDEQELFRCLHDVRINNNDVKLLHVLAPEEYDLGSTGIIRFVDSEQGHFYTCKTEEIRNDYRKELQNRIRLLNELSINHGIRYENISTDEYLPVVISRIIR